MPVRFQKMHGAGNDFVVLDLRAQEFPVGADKVRHIADRHLGIGCDQVLVLRDAPDPTSIAAFEVWNADGSRAEQCGNGVRCLALYLHRQKEATDEEFCLAGPVGPVTVQMVADAQIRVNMGPPDFSAAGVPTRLPETRGGYEIILDNATRHIGAVSMGNPHAVLVVDKVNETDVQGLGSSISRHAAFPEGCNVGFAEIVSREALRLRVFERGAGETRACGSGACAASVILQRAGRLGGRVEVFQDGGTLTIEWAGIGNEVFMTGPATFVFEGTLSND